MKEEEFVNEEVSCRSAEITLKKALDSGKEGVVYQVEEHTGYVVKIFNEEIRGQKEEKLNWMCESFPSVNILSHNRYQPLIWPEELVYDDSEINFLGYLMPHINTDAWENAQSFANKHLKWDETTWDERLKPAINLSIIAAVLHNNNYAIGDMSHFNILVKEGYISLIDCDSFSLKGPNGDIVGSTIFGRYAPPDGRGEDLQQDQFNDRFGLAIHLFQFMMEGYHPFQAKGPNAASGDFATMIRENRFPYEDTESDTLQPPTSSPQYQNIPKKFRDYFAECFINGKNDPSQCPPPIEWVHVLTNESSQFEVPNIDKLSKNIQATTSGYEGSASTQTGSGATVEYRDHDNDSPTERWEKRRQERRSKHRQSNKYESNTADASLASDDSYQNEESDQSEWSINRDNRDKNWVDEIREENTVQQSNNSSDTSTPNYQYDSSTSQSDSSINVDQIKSAIISIIYIILAFFIGAFVVSIVIGFLSSIF
ncbi:hypothetical protein [Haloarcula sp. Atlit-120R]|uniref:hypothetical protein n=1 Tax=Haloarcula sp. Atlit-120R TaxID=2282135 RepID=UPI0011C492F0|nr:hypothetical protein [Haloarcula sp. Atlit-120R]